MRYKYASEDKIIDVYRSKYHDNKVSVIVLDKEYDKDILEDADGKYFMWGDVKYYLDNFMKIHISDILQKIKDNKKITSDELCQMILTEGVENVRFEIPLANINARFGGLVITDPNNRKYKVCKIREGFSRMVDDNYKLDFYPEDNDMSVSCESFYTMDLVSSIQSGYIKLISTEEV